MWLRTECDLGGEQKQVALSDRRLNDFNPAIQVTLTEGPPAPQRRGRVEPRHRPQAFSHGFRSKAEDRTVVEEDIDVIVEPLRNRGRVVDRHPEIEPGT